MSRLIVDRDFVPLLRHRLAALFKAALHVRFKREKIAQRTSIRQRRQQSNLIRAGNESSRPFGLFANLEEDLPALIAPLPWRHFRLRASLATKAAPAPQPGGSCSGDARRQSSDPRSRPRHPVAQPRPAAGAGPDACGSQTCKASCLSFYVQSFMLAYRFPRMPCSRSIASNSALKFPLPKLRPPLRWIISKNTVGRSSTGRVKICSR